MGPFQLPQAGLTFPFILRCPTETGGKISSGSTSWPYWFPLMSWLMLLLRIPKKGSGSGGGIWVWVRTKVGARRQAMHRVGVLTSVPLRLALDICCWIPDVKTSIQSCVHLFLTAFGKIQLESSAVGCLKDRFGWSIAINNLLGFL